MNSDTPPGRGPVRRLFRVGLRSPSDREGAAWEVEHHLAEIEDQLVSDGWDPTEAKAEARRRFGNPDEHVRTMASIDRGIRMRKRMVGWGASLGGPLRFVGRMAKRSPGYVIAVVLTLGLGLGANGAMFEILDRLLLRPPTGVHEPDQVKRLFLERTFLERLSTSATLTFADVNDLRGVSSFSSVGAYTGRSSRVFGRGSDAELVDTRLATHDFFTTLGVQPFRGRFFFPEDDQRDAPLTAVLGHEFWASRFGEDPGVLGQTVDIDGTPFLVVGVAPPGFTGIGLSAVDFWLPLVPTMILRGQDTFLTHRGYWFVRAVARVTEGGDQTAEARATALHLAAREDRVASGRYDPNARMVLGSIGATPGAGMSRQSSVATWLAGVSLMVLLIACANVANLFLARAMLRKREAAVRLALGVSRERLVVERIFESVLLALLGGGAAVGIGYLATSIRAQLLPDVLWTQPGSAWRLVAVVAGLSLLAGLLAGVVPAFQGTKSNLVDDLRAGGRGETGRTSWIRSGLVIAQTAMSTMLLVGAGLFLKSMGNVSQVDVGIDASAVAQVVLVTEGSDLSAPDQYSLYQEAADRVQRLGSVESAVATTIPFASAVSEGIRVPGLDSIPRMDGGGPYYYEVGGGYFEALGLTLTAGRGLRDSDPGTDAVVVSATMARALWPEKNPIGACFYRGETDQCSTVVGVVEDASRGSIEEAEHMAYYLPLNVDRRPEALFVRVNGDMDQAIRQMSPVLRDMGAPVLFARVESIQQMLDPQTQAWRLGATMFSVFGVLAMIVAAVGLYSLLAFHVAARTRELGIRSALGAPRRDLLAGVVGRGASLGLIGVAVGLVGTGLAAPHVEALLFGVDGLDRSVLAVVAVGLVSVSALAALLPGLRATQVDPLVAFGAD